MSASALELAPQYEQLARFPSAETGRPPMQPGVVCIPYEVGTGTHAAGLSNRKLQEALAAGQTVQLSDHQRLHAAKAALEAQGVYCTLTLHSTKPVFECIADDGPDGHHNKLRDETEHFALFTLEGVGEPTRDALQDLTSPGGLYEGRAIEFGGETCHSRYYTNNPSTAPSEEAMALAVDVTALRQLLTGFQETLTSEQHYQWAGLQAEAIELEDRIRYMRSPADPSSTREHIQKVQAELGDKQQEIRDFLAEAVPVNVNAIVERRRQANSILTRTPEALDTTNRDLWIQLRDTHAGRVNMGTLRVVHHLQQQLAGIQSVVEFQIGRNAQLYPNGWPAEALTAQKGRMDRIAALNDRIRSLLSPAPPAAPVGQSQPEQQQQPSTEAEPRRRLPRILGWLAFKRRGNAA